MPCARVLVGTSGLAVSVALENEEAPRERIATVLITLYLLYSVQSTCSHNVARDCDETREQERKREREKEKGHKVA